MDVKKLQRGSGSRGVSLVGLLMVIVVLGALTATAMLGVSSLTGSGDGKATTPAEAAAALAAAASARAAPGAAVSGGAQIACRASADAARSASTLYFAKSGGRYPAKWSDMTTSNPPIYRPGTDAAINRGDPNELDGRGWKLVMARGGVVAPTFICS